MDHNSIINKNTFEVYVHAENHPDVFICDKQIANALATLNRKGYKTFASCSGHYKVEFYEYFNEDLSKLEEMKKDDQIIIKNINENGFDYWYEVRKTAIYVLFNEKYNFDNLPSSFDIEVFNGKTNLEHLIYYYDENNKKRNRQDVEYEIKKYCEILEKWANHLPIRKER